MNKIICAAAIILSIYITSGSALAQGRWESGFVILNNGDTLRGMLKDKSDLKIAKSITYSSGKKSVPVIYTPQNVKEFYIQSTDRWYRSLNFPDDTSGRTKMFFQNLVSGDATLYYLEDSLGNQRFFMKIPGGEIAELRIVVTEINTNDLPSFKQSGSTTGSAYFRQTDKEYLGIMRTGFAKCNKLVLDSTFDNTPLSLRPLGKKFIAYNKCVAPKTEMYIASRLKDRAAIELIFSAGPSFSKVFGPQFSSSGNISEEHNVMRGAKIHYGYSVGITSNFFLPQLAKSISIQTGIDFVNKGGYSAASKVTFNLHYLDFSVLVKYNYPHGILRPFAGLGLVSGYSLKGKDSYYRDLNGIRTYLNKDGYGIYQGFNVFYEIGLSGELGLKIALNNHALLCFMKYDYTKIPFTHGLQNYANSSFQLKIGYTYYFKPRKQR